MSGEHERCCFCPVRDDAASLHERLRVEGYHSHPGATPERRLVCDRAGRMVGEMSAAEAWRWVYAGFAMRGAVADVPSAPAAWRVVGDDGAVLASGSTSDGPEAARDSAAFYVSHLRTMGYAHGLRVEVSS